MATIQNATLIFPTGTRGSGLFQVTIQCEILWTPQERSIRPPANLEIRFRGDDGLNGIGPADQNLNVHIFHPEILDNLIVPSGAAVTNFNRTFEIDGRWLNEDDRAFNKRDEIYASLRLEPIGVTTAFANTNIVNGYFA